MVPHQHTSGTVHESDPDHTCRQLAEACGALQTHVAAQASHVLATSGTHAPPDLQAGVVAAANGLSALVLPGGGVLRAA